MKISRYLFSLLLLVPGLVRAQPAGSQETLHDAAYNGDIEAVRSFIELGVAADVRNPEESTALMWAGFNGHTEVVAFLLENGSDVNAMDGNGRTALMYASSGPFGETVTLLLENGAKVNIQDSLEGFSALMTGAAEGQLEVVEVLLAWGADPTLTDKDGDTAESFAEQNGHIQVFNLIRNPPTAAEEP